MEKQLGNWFATFLCWSFHSIKLYHLISLCFLSFISNHWLVWILSFNSSTGASHRVLFWLISNFNMVGLNNVTSTYSVFIWSLLYKYNFNVFNFNVSQVYGWTVTQGVTIVYYQHDRPQGCCCHCLTVSDGPHFLLCFVDTMARDSNNSNLQHYPLTNAVEL